MKQANMENEKDKTEEILEEQTDPVEGTTSEEAVSGADQHESLKMTIARLQADFANYKSRTERERKDMIRLANEGLIMKLLPVIDNFERAFGDLDTKDPSVEGFHMIYQNLMEILKKEGVTALECDGECFDPNLHHALFLEETDGVADDTVIETFQKGYTLGDKLIRPAMVKVSKNNKE